MNMDLSLTIIAVCLLILVIFALIAAIYLIQLLIVLKKTTQSVEQKVSPILQTVRKFTGAADETAEQVKSHIESSKPLFQAIGKVRIADIFSDKFKKNEANATSEVHLSTNQNKFNINDWMEWIALGIVLIQRLRKK